MTCSVDWCEADVYCKGFCSRHYKRFHRTGDPNGKGNVFKNARSQFVLTVIDDYKSDVRKSDCIIVPFSDGSAAYCGITVDGVRHSAHRFVCLSCHGGPSSNDLEAAHSCGVNRCINPLHLRWATAKENNADKAIHGTDNKGSAHPLAKLTDEAIAEIRMSQKRIDSRRLAEKYGVARATINAARRMKTWGHIDLIRPWPKGE